MKPRKTGDVNLLSWNQEKTKRDEQSAAAAEGVTTGFEKWSLFWVWILFEVYIKDCVVINVGY